MQVELLNFDEYLGRSGVKHPAWFCMDVDFLTRMQHFEKLTGNAVVVFVYVAGECVKAKNKVLIMSLRHAALYCMMDTESVLQALKKLEDVHLVRTTCADGAQKMCTEGREGKEGRGVRGESVPDSGERTYELLPEFQSPKPKRKKEPKPQLPCEAIPELAEIKAILEARKVPTLSQQNWLKQYSTPFIVRKIRALEQWLVDTGEVKKNYAQFFSVCMSRDAGQQDKPAAKPASEQAPRTGYFSQQLEAKLGGAREQE